MIGMSEKPFTYERYEETFSFVAITDTYVAILNYLIMTFRARSRSGIDATTVFLTQRTFLIV